MIYSCYEQHGERMDQKRPHSGKDQLKLDCTLVKPVLLYNSLTWGLSKHDTVNLDSFHRQQLQKIIEKSYPNKISNKTLYERYHEESLSPTITRSPWQLFGHILRPDEATPASKARKCNCSSSRCRNFSDLIGRTECN